MTKESLDLLYWIGGIIIGSGLIEISPLKINPWSWALTPLRKALTGPLTDHIGAVEKKVDKVQANLDHHIAVSLEGSAIASRQCILRFNDEILQHQKHTKEHFDEILGEIDKYEDYCADHPKFPNNKAIIAIENVKNTYNNCIMNDGFLSLDDEITEVRKKKNHKS